MKREEVEAEVRGILIDKLYLSEEEISSESSIKEDLGADSMDMLELIMEAENKFNITIPDDDSEQIVTVEDLNNCLCNLLSVEE